MHQTDVSFDIRAITVLFKNSHMLYLIISASGNALKLSIISGHCIIQAFRSLNWLRIICRFLCSSWFNKLQGLASCVCTVRLVGGCGSSVTPTKWLLTKFVTIMNKSFYIAYSSSTLKQTFMTFTVNCSAASASTFTIGLCCASNGHIITA